MGVAPHPFREAAEYLARVNAATAICVKITAILKKNYNERHVNHKKKAGSQTIDHIMGSVN